MCGRHHRVYQGPGGLRGGESSTDPQAAAACSVATSRGTATSWETGWSQSLSLPLCLSWSKPSLCQSSSGPRSPSPTSAHRTPPRPLAPTSGHGADSGARGGFTHTVRQVPRRKGPGRSTVCPSPGPTPHLHASLPPRRLACPSRGGTRQYPALSERPRYTARSWQVRGSAGTQGCPRACVPAASLASNSLCSRPLGLVFPRWHSAHVGTSLLAPALFLVNVEPPGHCSEASMPWGERTARQLRDGQLRAHQRDPGRALRVSKGDGDRRLHTAAPGDTLGGTASSPKAFSDSGSRAAGSPLGLGKHRACVFWKRILLRRPVRLC